jgi:nucleotide-binding universal stress UspA family protein
MTTPPLPREIVVGVDNSAASGRALDRALWETQDLDRPLQVVHAWSTPISAVGFGGVAYLPPVDDEQELASHLVNDLLAKALARCGSQRPLEVRAQAVQGDPARTLLSVGKDAALIIVGGRGHGYVSSALLGSVTSFVLHHASGPVMVVPEQGPPAGRFGKVVVGVDGSPGSAAALRWGIDAARREDCPLIALHAGDATQTWPDLPEHHGVDVTSTTVPGPAAAALMAAAQDGDLLVTGSRGRGGFASLVLGSVATQCVQHSRSVVVVVKAEQDRLDS